MLPLLCQNNITCYWKMAMLPSICCLCDLDNVPGSFPPWRSSATSKSSNVRFPFQLILETYILKHSHVSTHVLIFTPLKMPKRKSVLSDFLITTFDLQKDRKIQILILVVKKIWVLNIFIHNKKMPKHFLFMKNMI